MRDDFDRAPLARPNQLLSYVAFYIKKKACWKTLPRAEHQFLVVNTAARAGPSIERLYLR